MRFPKRNYSRGIGDASHFPKFKVSSCQNHPTRPETGNNWTIYQNRTLPKKEFFGGKWREYGRNKRKYGRLWKSLQERARLNTSYYFVGFPKRRNYSRGSGDALHFPKIKVSSCQLKRNYKHRMLSLSHSFPPRVLWKEMKGMLEKCGEVWKKWKYVGKSQWWRWWLNIILWEFPSFFLFCSTI